jgi:hypothetical protein
MSCRALLGLALTLILAIPSRAPAHEIPASVTVLAFVKPDGQRLRILLRVPLEAIRDVDFPLHGPGYIDIAGAGPLLPDAVKLWIADYIELYEGDTRLGKEQIVAARIALPGDRSFENWQSALAGVGRPPLPVSTELVWQQALLDVLLEYPIAAEHSNFAIRPALAHLGVRTATVLRFLPPGGAERVFQFSGNPGLVRLDPRWHQAALRFIALGFRHILDGLDHLLFVLCLVIPIRRMRPLIAIVTSFTVAHSITLIASALGLAPRALWFPPLIETLIALSILWMAFENIIGPMRPRQPVRDPLERRWMFAFGFGLVHGFGFSFFLGESLQFAGSHLASALVAFNVGVELGQLFVIALALPVLAFLFRTVVAERMGTILLSALVAHTAWHWLTERASALREHRFQWPAMDLVLLANVARGLMLLLILMGAVWLLYGWFGRLLHVQSEGESAAGAER